MERTNGKKKKRRKGLRFLGELVIMTMIVVLSSVCVVAYNILAYPNAIRAVENKSYNTPRTAEDILRPREMREDLDYLRESIYGIHPIFAGVVEEEDQTGLKEAFEKAYEKVRTSMTVGDFYYVVREVMATLEDGHTIPMGVYGEQHLRAELKWVDDKLYVIGSSYLKAYDEIIEIGDMAIEELYQRAQCFIAAENEQAARKEFITHIGTPRFLEACGVSIEDLDITVLRDERRVKLPFRTMGVNYVYDPNPYEISYTIDEEAGVCHFVMKTCEYSDAYIAILDEMFTEIAARGLETLVVDIRQNAGGHSMVCNELMRYMPVETFENYGCEIRYSEEASNQRGYFLTKGVQRFEPTTVLNEQYTDLLFYGDVYILVDDVTFSSANWLAVTFQDAAVATIVGEPTTNDPNSYGDILTMQMPHSSLKFIVSHKKWITANRERELDDALIPDVVILPTLLELVEKEDVLIRWVYEQLE